VSTYLVCYCSLGLIKTFRTPTIFGHVILTVAGQNRFTCINWWGKHRSQSV